MSLPEKSLNEALSLLVSHPNVFFNEQALRKRFTSTDASADKVLVRTSGSFFRSDSMEKELLNFEERLSSNIAGISVDLGPVSIASDPAGILQDDPVMMSRVPLKWRRSIFGVIRRSSTFQ